MLFAKRLREGVRQGTITCTVRIWKSLRVQIGRRYRMDEGEVEVDSIEPMVCLTSLRSWRAHQDLPASWICSKLRSMGPATRSI